MGGLTPSNSHCTIKVPARCQYICYFQCYSLWNEGNKRHPQALAVTNFSCNTKNISPTYTIHIGREDIFFLLIQYKKNQ